MGQVFDQQERDTDLEKWIFVLGFHLQPPRNVQTGRADRPPIIHLLIELRDG